MTEPLFSFVVPVFGTEKYLRRCLDSVFSQSDPDCEVIVVDDASPGNCGEIVRDYPTERVTYVRHDRNLSLLQARVTGVRVSKGRFIVPLDSDDYVMPELLTNVRKEIEADGAADVFVYQMELDEGGRILPAWHNHAAGGMACADFLSLLFRQEASWCLCGKVIRRETYFRAVELMQIDADCYINSTEDLCQMIPILLTGGRLRFVGCRGYRYFHNTDSLSKSSMSLDRLRICARQNRKSISLGLNVARRIGASEMLKEQIGRLDRVTVEWLLSLYDQSSDSLWNSAANALCDIYGLEPVVEVMTRKYPRFLLRFEPDATICAHMRGPCGQVSVIGVVCARAFGGGAEKATQVWARRQARFGRKVVWLYKPEYRQEVQLNKGDDLIEFIPLDGQDAFLRLRELKRIKVKRSVDTFLLVDHWSEQTPYDIVCLKALGARVIAAEHSAFFFPLDDCALPVYQARCNAYKLADGITALSPENVAWWKASGADRVAYVPNYLPVKAIPNGKRGVVERFHRRNLLFVGRICKRKGALQILEAFAILLRMSVPRCDDLKLVFLGRFDNNDYRKRILYAVERFGLGDRIVFPGEVRDVDPYLDSAVLMLSASRIEGAPLTFVEAKAKGVPIVCFDLPFVVGTGEREGVVSVPTGDVEAFARAMRGCLTDERRYCQLSLNAVSSLGAFEDAEIDRRWQSLFSHVSAGRPVDPMCEEVSSDRMLELTMDAVRKTTAPMLSDGLSASCSTDSLLGEANDLVRRVLLKIRDKRVEFGVLGVCAFLCRKMIYLLRCRFSRN